MNKHFKKHAGARAGFVAIACGITWLTMANAHAATTNNSTDKKTSIMADGAAFVKYGGAGVFGNNYGGGGPMVDIGGQWGNHRFFLNVAGYFGNISSGSYLGSNAFLLATTLNYGYQLALGKDVRLTPSVGVGYPYVTARLDAEFGTEQTSGGFFFGAYLDNALSLRGMAGGFAITRF